MRFDADDVLVGPWVVEEVDVPLTISTHCNGRPGGTRILKVYHDPSTLTIEVFHVQEQATRTPFEVPNSVVLLSGLSENTRREYSEPGGNVWFPSILVFADQKKKS